MNSFKVLLVVASLAAGTSALAANYNNKITYGGVQPGMRLENFMPMIGGISKKKSGTFFKLEQQSKTDFNILVKRPETLNLFDTYIKRMPVTMMSRGSLKCDSIIGGIFISDPKSVTGSSKTVLYSYDYLVCAGGGSISPSRLLEKYIEKYGNYTKKDFDRDQAVYIGVQKRYEVRVKPVKVGKNSNGLIITISDSDAFMKTYSAWRARIRKLEKDAQKKF